METTEATAVLSYPQRSDGQRMAELTITDKRSGLPIVTLTMTPAQVVDMISSTHASDYSTAELADPAHRWKIGRHQSHRSLHLGRDAWDAAVNDLTREAQQQVADWLDALPDVEDGWHLSGQGRNRDGVTVTYRCYTTEALES